MPKVKVIDIQIYYEVHGEGFPLIMINGLGAHVDSWDPRARALMVDRSALSPEEIVRMSIPILFTDTFIKNNPTLWKIMFSEHLRSRFQMKPTCAK